jgi:hypothetical protein
MEMRAPLGAAQKLKYLLQCCSHILAAILVAPPLAARKPAAQGGVLFAFFGTTKVMP